MITSTFPIFFIISRVTFKPMSQTAIDAGKDFMALCMVPMLFWMDLGQVSGSLTLRITLASG